MITIAGAGVAGLACGYELAKRGERVRIYDRAPDLAGNACSWFAGGMLAPWCEGETAEPEVVRLGAGAINWWAQFTPVTRRGTLVVAPPRDQAELARFARRTERHRSVTGDEIAHLEAALAGRFNSGLFFEDEAHLDPHRALADLRAAVADMGVEILWNTPAPDRVDLDCRGIQAGLPGLRAVRGEMAVIHAPDVHLTRTIRLLHPRVPVYIVPRSDGHYMLGATMVESDARGPVTIRAMLELLGAAFALHPGLAEAQIIETGAGLRPAFDDNIPRVQWRGDTLHVNGLYRHGFLIAPALAKAAAAHLTPQRREAS